MIKRRTIAVDGLSSGPARWPKQGASCQRRVSGLHLLCLVLSCRRFIVRPRKAVFGRVWGEALKKAQGVSKTVTLKRGASRWPEVEERWCRLADQGLGVANECGFHGQEKQNTSVVDGGSVDGVEGVLTVHRLLMYFSRGASQLHRFRPSSTTGAILSLWLCETDAGALA
jgi:hypothetical protein